MDAPMAAGGAGAGNDEAGNIGAGNSDTLPVKTSRKRTCVVCGPTSRKLHKIPKNDRKRAEWLEALGLRSEDVKKTARVCENHFAAGEDVPSLTTGDAAADVQAMVVEANQSAMDMGELEVSVVAKDVDADKDVDAAKDVDGEQEGGRVLPPKRAWQLQAQVEDKDATIARLTAMIAVKKDENTRLTNMLAVKEDENGRLKEQNGILSQMNDRKNEELEKLRKKVKSLQTMLKRTRKEMKAGNSKE